jgi:hypothetical protein
MSTLKLVLFMQHPYTLICLGALLAGLGWAIARILDVLLTARHQRRISCAAQAEILRDAMRRVVEAREVNLRG